MEAAHRESSFLVAHGPARSHRGDARGAALAKIGRRRDSPSRRGPRRSLRARKLPARQPEIELRAAIAGNLRRTARAVTRNSPRARTQDFQDWAFAELSCRDSRGCSRPPVLVLRFGIRKASCSALVGELVLAARVRATIGR